MKVLMVNGSPNKEGCTFTALSEVAGSLHQNGIETEMFHIGNKAFFGCMACEKCVDIGKCVIDGDIVNELAEKFRAADGVVVGSPVYYAGPNGALCVVLDRVFYQSRGRLKHKPAACVVSLRRGGASAAFDRLNKYFSVAQMHIITSQYWNSVHGMNPDEVRRDLEGLQVLRTLGRNMAWVLKLIEKGAPPPELEAVRQLTAFADGKQPN